ncbi:MAG: glycosyltransferase family 2 protein [Armatimonas sp.]
MELSIVIPAYNEEKRLPGNLPIIKEFLDGMAVTYEIIVVDDGSKDRTSELIAAVPYVRLITLSENQGKGAAVKTGVLAAKGDYILFMDADLATALDEIPKVLRIIKEKNVGMVFGSRDMPDSQLVKHQPGLRELSGRMFNKVVQALAVPGVVDTQCGFKIFTRAAAQEIFSRMTLNRFSFDVEIIYLAQKLGLGCLEVPVKWEHKEGAAAFTKPGDHLKHGLRMIRDVSTIRWRHKGLQPLPKTERATS